MTKNGIDVSYVQNNVNWQKVKASGVDFAIVRVGWCYNNGALKEDVHFKKHISGALAAGLDVGVYLYSYATTAEAARRAAKEVIEAVKPYKLSYPIAFDIEYESIYTGGSKQVNTDICKAFLDEIEAAGYYAMLYCSKDFLDTYLDHFEAAGYDIQTNSSRQLNWEHAKKEEWFYDDHNKTPILHLNAPNQPAVAKAVVESIKDYFRK